MEKISSWHDWFPKDVKFPEGQRRSKSPTQACTCFLIIFKCFLDIKANKNIFLPETLFTEYFNSFVSHSWKRKLAWHSKIYYFTKIYILFRPPRRTSRHHTILLSSFYSTGWNKEQTEQVTHRSEIRPNFSVWRKQRSHLCINLMIRYSDWGSDIIT